VMDAGRVVEFGEATQVLQAPKSAVTRELLDAVPRLG
jgi:ABC-type dipeptide/oligopeptide/nickel transport system ATPase component